MFKNKIIIKFSYCWIRNIGTLCTVEALLKESVMRANWESVVEKVLSYPNSDELGILFQLLLTEEERSAVAGRLKVFQLLLQGDLSQRQISADYQVSIATITRCSNYLKNMQPEQKQKIQQLLLD